MTVPELVRERLGEGSVRARVSLQGEDELVVATDRTLLYRGEGLLSGESLEEISHDAESVSVSEGRRKSTVRLDHGIDGESEFTLPSARLDDALAPLLGGVLAAAGVTDTGESVEGLYRLGELTVIITEGRVVKHVGSAVWDHEFEEYAFEDVTEIGVEEGDVSSQIIVEVGGRPQRIKAPSEDVREIRERIERALLAYHDVDSYREFKRAIEADGPTDADGERRARDADVETDSIDAVEEGATEETARTEPAGESRGEDSDAAEEGDFEFEAVEVEGEEETVAEELAALREAVERQNELLETQQRALEVLIEELRD